MSFRTTFTKKVKDTNIVWSRDTPGPSPEFLRQYESAIEIAPLMNHPIVNGYNQYMIDGFASCKTEAEFHAKVDKNWNNVNNGLVRASSQAVIVKKTPIETEILRLAAEFIDGRIAEKSKVAGYKKPTAAERLALVEFRANDKHAEYHAIAMENLKNGNAIKSNADVKAAMDELLADMEPAPKNKRAA